MDSIEKMYSVKEVSLILGWSPDTIRRFVDRGDHQALGHSPGGAEETAVSFHEDSRLRSEAVHPFSQERLNQGRENRPFRFVRFMRFASVRGKIKVSNRYR